MPDRPKTWPSTRWIVRYRLRALGRSLRAQAFEWLALAPLILGGALWVLHRLLGDLRPILRAVFEGESGGETLATVVRLGLLAWTAAQLPAIWRELFAPGALSDACDASPTPPLARWNTAWIALWGRNLIPAAGLCFATFALADADAVAAPWLGDLVRWLAVALALTFIQLPLGLVLIRFGLLSDSGLLGLALGLGALALLPAGGTVLLPWWPAATLAEETLTRALALEGATNSPVWVWWMLGLEVPVLGTLGGWLYLRWWRRLRDSASVARRPGPGLAGRFERWLPRMVLGSPELRALVVRDLRLVWRRFSAAVPLALAVAAVGWVAVARTLAHGGLSAPGQRRLVILGGGLVAVAVAALVPLLLAHQLPRLWMEKGSGVDFERLGQAKSTTALLLVAPWLLATAILPLVLGGLSPAQAWATAGLTILAGWMASAMVAAAVWEIATQPLLGLVSSALLGLAFVGLLAFYPEAWWMWLVVHFWIVGLVAGRAGRRVRFTEIVR